MSVQQASQEGPCEAVPRDGFTTVAEHSSCAARELSYEVANPWEHQASRTLYIVDTFAGGNGYGSLKSRC